MCDQGGNSMFTKKLKNSMFHSVISRFLLFFFLLFLIILIQNAGVNLYARQTINQNLLTEKKVSLSVQMSQVDRELTNLNSFIIQTVSKNTDYLKLLHMEEKNGNDYRIINSYVALGNKFDEQLNFMSYEEGFFAIFPEKDVYLFRGYNDAVQKVIRQLTEKQESLRSQWMVLDANGSNYIVCIYRQKSSWCGAWLAMDSVIDGLQKIKGDQYFFADEYGHALTGCPAIPIGGAVPEDGTVFRWENTGYHKVAVVSDLFDLSLVELVNGSELMMKLPGIYIFFGVFTVAALLAGALFLGWLRKNMIHPLRKLNKAILRVEDGDLQYRIAPDKSDNEFEVLNQEFNGMLEQVNSLKLNIYEMTIEQQRTKLRYLSQQIQPHFILNVLNILYSYEAQDHVLIRRMILYLSKYFRYIVNIHSDFVRLGAELSHVENYLQIQKVRYPYQFDYEIKMDDRIKNAGIPPLLIQTFVENSIKYAVSSKTVIHIFMEAVCLETGFYELMICDTGPGYAREVLDGLHRFMESGVADKSPGIGIVNAIERLAIIYHGEARLRIENRQPHGAMVRIVLPIVAQEPDIDEDLD